jgi:hypothetical protein
MVGEAPPGLPGAKAASNPAAGARSFVLTANVRRNAELNLVLEAEDEQKAVGLGMMLQGLSGMAGLGTAQAQTAGKEVRLSLVVRPEDLKAKTDQLMASFKQQIEAAGFGKSVAASTLPPPQPEPEPELPPEKRVIRIHGLDEGVREIPMEK